VKKKQKLRDKVARRDKLSGYGKKDGRPKKLNVQKTLKSLGIKIPYLISSLNGSGSVGLLQSTLILE
jgi:hypothetical protein